MVTTILVLSPVALAIDPTTDKLVAYNGGENIGYIDGSTCSAVACAEVRGTMIRRLATPRPAVAPASSSAVGHSNLLLVNRVDLAVNPATNTLYASVADTSGTSDFVDVQRV